MRWPMATPSRPSKPYKRALLDVVATIGILPRSSPRMPRTSAPVPPPTIALRQHLPVDQRNGVFDAGHAVDAAGDRA